MVVKKHRIKKGEDGSPSKTRTCDPLVNRETGLRR